MNNQEYFRQEYHRLKPLWQDSLQIYGGLVESNTNSETKILDVGCGHSDFLQAIYDKTNHSYGLVLDQRALEKNVFIKNKMVGSINHMPFENNFFDLVVTAWVFEHLQSPQTAIQEIFRVLKPGGKVIFLTPNIWNYNVWIIRLIPEIFHDFLVRKLYDRQEFDTYPKYYKINSSKKITEILKTAGFQKLQLIFNGDPSYISFNYPLFKIACLLEKIMDWKVLNFTKVHLIGVYEKNH